jgi:hypothetical protein
MRAGATMQRGNSTVTSYPQLWWLITVAAMVLMPGWDFAKTPSSGAMSVPPPGQATAKADMVPSLIVTNTRGAGLQVRR